MKVRVMVTSKLRTQLKKQKKGMVVTWSDEESEDEGEDITANVVKALTVKGNVEEDSSDEEIF